LFFYVIIGLLSYRIDKLPAFLAERSLFVTGSIQTKKGRANYYAVLNYYDDAGKRKQKWIDTEISIKGNNKRKANAKLNSLLSKYSDQKIDIGIDILFTEFMTDWLENLKHSIAPTTYEGYRLVLKSHILPYFRPKKLKIKDLSPAHIQQYVNFKMKTLSPNTIIKHLRNISKCLDNAVKQNIIAFNPTKRIEMPKKIKYTGAKHYNEKQIERLLERTKDDPLEIVILLTVFYGLRRSEVLGVKWDAIDFDNNVITIRHTVTKYNKEVYKKDTTKNDSSYALVPLPNFIKNNLKAWRARQNEYKLLQPNDYIDEGYVCTLPDGRLIQPDFVSHHFGILLERNNMPIIRFHDLRHSSANYLKYLGFDLKDIQTWLRHKDIQTTMNIYVNLDMSAKTDIANSLNEKFENMICGRDVRQIQ